MKKKWQCAREFMIRWIHRHIQKHWRPNVHFFLRSEAGQNIEWSGYKQVIWENFPKQPGLLKTEIQVNREAVHSAHREHRRKVRAPMPRAACNIAWQMDRHLDYAGHWPLLPRGIQPIFTPAIPILQTRTLKETQSRNLFEEHIVWSWPPGSRVHVTNQECSLRMSKQMKTLS